MCHRLSFHEFATGRLSTDGIRIVWIDIHAAQYATYSYALSLTMRKPVLTKCYRGSPKSLSCVEGADSHFGASRYNSEDVRKIVHVHNADGISAS